MVLWPARSGPGWWQRRGRILPGMGDGGVAHGVLIFTCSSRLLVECAVGAYAQRPVLLAEPLCQLLATMQDLAGHPQFGFVELHGVSVLLLEGYRVIVAVLCEPRRELQDSSRLIGMQALNVFGKLFREQVETLDRDHQLETSEAVNSYTFHSATSHMSGGATLASATPTLPVFHSFRQEYLLPLLLQRSAQERWLAPLLGLSCALRAMLVNPAPLAQQVGVLLSTAPRAGRPLASAAGPQLPTPWAHVLEAALSVLRLLSTANDKQNKRARLALLCFPNLADGGVCLHVAMRAVRVIPGGACLLLFYEASAALPHAGASVGVEGSSGFGASVARVATGPMEPHHRVGSAGSADASIRAQEPTAATSLSEAAVPPELRTALNSSARAIAAAFPMEVTALPSRAELDEVDEPQTTPVADEGSLPRSHAHRATPIKSLAAARQVGDGDCAGEIPSGAGAFSPLQLSIESPRAPLGMAVDTHEHAEAAASSLEDTAAPTSTMRVRHIRKELYMASGDGADAADAMAGSGAGADEAGGDASASTSTSTKVAAQAQAVDEIEMLSLTVSGPPPPADSRSSS